MSNFKLSWLKLDVNILDDTKIKILRKYPGGNDLIVLWIGIMCLAMKSDNPGKVEISNGIPYDPESLGYELGIDTKTVELGLSLFVKFNMINVMEGGMIDVINFSKHQDLDRIEYKRQQNRERQAKFREKHKNNALLISDSHSSTPIRVDKSIVEESREEKIRVDKDKIKENIKKMEISDKLKEKLFEYVDYRKEIKKTLKSTRSITAVINKIGVEFTDEDHLMESIDQSIMNEYQGIFPTKKGFNKNKPFKATNLNRSEPPVSKPPVIEAEIVEEEFPW